MTVSHIASCAWRTRCDGSSFQRWAARREIYRFHKVFKGHQFTLDPLKPFPNLVHLIKALAELLIVPDRVLRIENLAHRSVSELNRSISYRAEPCVGNHPASVVDP